ncbi:hypothetical protein FA95DRAFT_1614267 [Auriscalpium vulgare]|uniref:Uncharacterized protein n=1 Tax=Auriscalpium vulgare TaxID=40419 RepID=A0ACB8QZV4_9AGAM|nr:hypothetical protein FA95DRAFT_1614267 [Auriscalpium vulgare]
MSRITLTLDVPTDDLADRLANLTVNFSPKKPSNDGKATSASSARSSASAKSKIPKSSDSPSVDATVSDDNESVEPKEGEQEPWDGEALVVFKGVGPGVYRIG